jgi:L-alanine-DL-glutamate epimerase-like enolase superfamily enzyme
MPVNAPRITDVEATTLAVPPRDRRIPWIWGTFSQVLVEVRTDDGLTGWGEAFGYGAPQAVAAVVNHTLRPLLLGQDASDIPGRMDALFRATHLWGRYGVTTFGISGVDIALWDLAGKRMGKPLFELLGGAGSRAIAAYGSLVRYRDLDMMAEHASQWARAGSPMIKLHQIDTESVRRGREAIGDLPLTVDVNCEWTPLEAIEMARAMNEYHLYWLEEPVFPPEDFAALARVNRATGVPLASGENACTAQQFSLLVDSGAAAFVQPSVTKVGGISEFLKVANLVETRNLCLAPHSPYFGPGFLATLHLLAHLRPSCWIERLHLDLETSLFAQPLEIEGATYMVPDGPGLGLEVDRNVLRDYQSRP